MTNASLEVKQAEGAWSARQVYGMAAICLAAGLCIGYLFRGSQPTSSVAPSEQAGAAPTEPTLGGDAVHPMPSLEQMKRMADTKAAPLLEKLKSDPNNTNLILQVAAIYNATHQFREAAGYYDRALKIEPKNVAVRTQLAACLYYQGNADGALSQLQESLRENPKDANSLFNQGVILWKAKNDAAGAIAVWQRLLKDNPGLERKPLVERLIAEARQGASSR